MILVYARRNIHEIKDIQRSLDKEDKWFARVATEARSPFTSLKIEPSEV